MSQDSYTRSFLVNRSPLKRPNGYLMNCHSDAYLDSLIRHDYRRPNCSSRSKLCGNACIPKTKKCRIGKRELNRIVARHENQIRNLPKEEARAIDPDTGEMSLRKGGDETSVYFTNSEIKSLNGKILTHNHPNLGWDDDDPRSQGMGFSKDDLEFAAIANLKEIRAVTRNYNHSLSLGKGQSWDSNAIAKSYDKQFNRHYWKAMGQILIGKVSAEQAEVDIHHNIVSDVAKELGLKYSRQRVR